MAYNKTATIIIMRPAYLIVSILIIVSFFAGIYAYPLVSDTIPSHWNAAGEVDRYTDKFLGLFLMPLVMIPILALFIAIPRIDPLKKNVEKFREYFDGFIVIMVLFFIYVQLLVTATALGYAFNMTVAIMPAIALLMFYAGAMMEKSKRNWFIGIKTPWTLSSDKIWDKTHKLGGKLFKIAAVISLATMVTGVYGIWIFVVSILVAAFYPVVYSYFEYKKLPKKKK